MLILGKGHEQGQDLGDRVVPFDDRQVARSVLSGGALMISMFSAAAMAFLISIGTTPYAINVLRSRNIGQFIQQEVEGHSHKHGTPTMGGIVIVVAVLAGISDVPCLLLDHAARDSGWVSSI